MKVAPRAFGSIWDSKLLNFQLKSCYSNRSRSVNRIIFYFTSQTYLDTCLFPFYLATVYNLLNGIKFNDGTLNIINSLSHVKRLSINRLLILPPIVIKWKLIGFSENVFITKWINSGKQDDIIGFE